MWLPPGRWVDWWRSASFTEPRGSYLLGRLRLLRGGRDVTLPAPLGQPPLLLRAGAVLPLLGADVDTLSPYGRGPGLVRLADRANRLRLLAVPRGRTRSRLPDGGRASSAERRRGGRWILRLRMPRRTLFTVEASLGSLRRPFRPRRVLLNGKRLSRKRWRYDRRARRLRVRVAARRAVLDVRRRVDWRSTMSHRGSLPQLEGGLFFTDGGLETTLIFHRGRDLPAFAAFDLLKDDDGTEELRRTTSSPTWTWPRSAAPGSCWRAPRGGPARDGPRRPDTRRRRSRR